MYPETRPASCCHYQETTEKGLHSTVAIAQTSAHGAGTSLPTFLSPARQGAARKTQRAVGSSKAEKLAASLLPALRHWELKNPPER